MKKKILYSFLCGRERALTNVLSNDAYKTVRAAKNARKYTSEIFGYKPGPIVKVTLEKLKF